MAEDKKTPPRPTFSIDPVLYRKDDNGEPLLDDKGEKIIEREIGHFEFRVPTLGDLLEMGVRKAARLRGMGVDSVDLLTDKLSTILAALPYLALSVPDKWSWETLYPKDSEAVAEVYRCYTEALEKF